MSDDKLGAAQGWPKAINVKRGEDHWHADVSFARYPTDDELKNLHEFLRVNFAPPQGAPLPCPFCGGEDIEVWTGFGTQADISCQSCGCERGVQVADMRETGEPYPEFDQKTFRYPQWLIDRTNRHLLEDWNTRAGIPAAGASSDCCKGLAPPHECRCEIERKAQGHPPYQRSPAEGETVPKEFNDANIRVAREFKARAEKAEAELKAKEAGWNETIRLYNQVKAELQAYREAVATIPPVPSTEGKQP